jgi:hypothetical protein
VGALQKTSGFGFPSFEFFRVMASRLKNKWVLITGASSGFGAAAGQSVCLRSLNRAGQNPRHRTSVKRKVHFGLNP